MPPVEINWLSVLVGTGLYMGLGALWYGPLFSKPWLRAMGYSGPEEVDQTNMGLAYLSTSVGSFVAALILAIFVDWAEATSLLQGAMVGLLALLAVLVPLAAQLLAFEPRDRTVTAIGAGYNLVAFVLIGMLHAVWT